MTSVDAGDERSELDGMSGAMLPKAASRVTRRGTVVKLEHGHGGDEGRKDGPDRRWGEAHVAEWHRVGAKRVLGDVGRGERSGAPERVHREHCRHGQRRGGDEGRLRQWWRRNDAEER